MRSDIDRLEAVGGPELTQELLRLSWLCLCCAHVHLAQDVDRPRAFRALATGKVTCAQGLELPTHGRLCPGFTLARKTDGNERPQKALPSSVDCCTIGAPKSTKRRSKSLSNSPRVGKILVTAFADFTCRFFGQVFAHIGQITTSGDPRGPGGFLVAGERCDLSFFIFPNTKRYSHV